MKTLSVEASVVKFLDKNKGQKFVVAVSGGVDSMVLLHCLLRYIGAEDLVVAHVNHGTRKECAAEEEMVKSFAKSNGVLVRVKRLTAVPERNKEAAWREIRQAFFTEVAKKHSCDKVLTAHHTSDLVETMIYRSIKGSTVMGAMGFSPDNKPLYHAVKRDIYKYAEKYSVPFSEDESNKNAAHARNRIRQNVVPELRKITPNMEAVYLQSAQNMTEIQQFLDESVAEYIQKKQILLRDFLALHNCLQRHLLQSVVASPMQRDINECLRWLRNNPRGNTHRTLKNTTIRLMRGRVIFESGQVIAPVHENRLDEK